MFLRMVRFRDLLPTLSVYSSSIFVEVHLTRDNLFVDLPVTSSVTPRDGSEGSPDLRGRGRVPSRRETLECQHEGHNDM